MAAHRPRRRRQAGWVLAAALPVVLTVVVATAGPALAATEVTAANLAFAPASAPVQMVAGEPGYPAPHGHVVWTNTDPSAAHTVTFDDARLRSSGPLASGQRHEVVVEAAGTFAYRCTIHPGMTGTLVVSPAPAPVAEPAADAAEPDAGSSVPPAAALVVAAGATGLVWFLVRRRSTPRSADR